MKVGLFFGTFNPIHVGHLVIAEYLAVQTDLDEVWLVVSPHNPLKDKKSLLPDHHRMALVRVAIEDNPRLKVSDIEFKLPQPSYTSTTLAYLQEKHPSHEFSLILGEDNLITFKRWYNFEQILTKHKLYVYPRAATYHELALSGETTRSELYDHPHVHLLKDAPVMKISASYIRKSIRNGKSVRYLLSEPVYRYIDEMNFYR